MTDITAHKAAEIASALERIAKDVRKVTDMLPDGFGDRRTPDFGNAIGCIGAQAKNWSNVMWAVAAQKKQNAA
jgi:hypothetical protein